MKVNILFVSLWGQRMKYGVLSTLASKNAATWSLKKSQGIDKLSEKSKVFQLSCRIKNIH